MTQLLEVHHPTPYENMQPMYPAAVIWHGDGGQPAAAWSCSYGTDDIFVFLFWLGANGGSEIGFFPLGGSDESLHSPMIGLWKQIDPSLTSIGSFERGQLTLLPPEVDRPYFEQTLSMAGKPCSEENVMRLVSQTAMLFGLKAQGYIELKGGDAAAARFMANLPPERDVTTPATILQKLAEWNPQVIPYVQDLPWRIRGILLEPGPDGLGTFWNEFD